MRRCATAPSGSLRNTKNAEERVQLDLRYVGQDFTLSVPVSVKDIRKGDRKAIRTAFDKLYEHRYAHSSPEDPVEMVNMRLSVIGKRPTLKFPRLGKGRASAITHRRDVYFSRRQEGGALPGLSAREAHRRHAHRRAGAGAGARHHDGAVPEGRVHGRAVRRIDHQGGRRVMAKARKQAALKRKPQASVQSSARPSARRSIRSRWK